MPYANFNLAGTGTISFPAGRNAEEMCRSLGCPGFTEDFRYFYLRGPDIASVFGEEERKKLPREVRLRFRLTQPSKGVPEDCDPNMRIVLKDRQFWIADDRDVRTWPFYKPALEQYLEYTTAEWQYDLYQAMRSALMADMPVRIAVHTHEQKQMTEFTAGHIANTTGGPQYNAKNVVCVVVSKQTPVGSVLS